MSFLILICIVLYFWAGYRYRSYGHFDETRFVEGHAGWDLALNVYKPKKSNGESVYLQHGLAANGLNFDLDGGPSLPRWLTQQGYTVYVGNLRGKGTSRPRDMMAQSVRDFCFDDYLQDVATLMKAIRVRHKNKSPHLVGHSLGGILGYAYTLHAEATAIEGDAGYNKSLARPDWLPPQSLLTIGSALDYSVGANDFQFIAKTRFLGPLLPVVPMRLLSRMCLPLLGFHNRFIQFNVNASNTDREVMASMLVSSPENEPYVLLDQLADMVLGQGLKSLDGQIRYSEKLVNIKHTPVAAFAGSVDAQCPVHVAHQTLEKTGSNNRLFEAFGRNYGHNEDYGHADLLCGRHADTEVFPKVAFWLNNSADEQAIASTS